MHHDNSKERLRAALQGGATLSYEQLKQRLGLSSERQINRLINELRKEGMVIKEGRPGKKDKEDLEDRKRLAEREGHDSKASRIKVFWLEFDPQRVDVPIQPLLLSDRQALALAVAASASRAAMAPTPMGPDLDAAFGRLLNHLGPNLHAYDLQEEAENWHFGVGAASAFKHEIFNQLADAIREQQSITIDYLTASTGEHSTGRRVDPYALAVRGGSWMLVAYCHRRHDIRDFSVAGISRVEKVSPDESAHAYFEVPEEFDLDQYFAGRFNALEGDGDLVTVKLLVEPQCAVYFKRKRYHASQRIETERPDGRIVVVLRASSLEEIGSFVQSWGSLVTVLEPSELARMVAAEAREVAARYAEVSGTAKGTTEQSTPPNPAHA